MNIIVNPQLPIAIYRQIVDQIVQHLAAGQLLPGDQLPSIRSLSTQLRINPNTVIKSYRELELRGFAESRHGKGYFATVDSALKAHRGWHKRAREDLQSAVESACRMGVSSVEILEIVNETLKREDPGHE